MRAYKRGWTLAIFLACTLGGSVSMAQQGQETQVKRLPERYALLIAIDNYSEIRDLKYCNADIDGLKLKLIEAGFSPYHVLSLRDSSSRPQYVPVKSNIEKQLELLLATVSEEDLVVIAFSGHGVHMEGRSYLCPMDAQLDATGAVLRSESLVPLDWAYERLKQCRARQKLLLIDACRNDPNPGGTRSTMGAKSVSDFAASLLTPPEGIIVLTACTPGQISVEDPKVGHGVFMYYLMMGLEGRADRDRDDDISLLELYQYAEVKTKLHVRLTRNLVQTPELRGRISGDYVLAKVPLRVSKPLGPVAEPLGPVAEPSGPVAEPSGPVAEPSGPVTPEASTSKPSETRPKPPAEPPTPASPTPVDKNVRLATMQADEFFRQRRFDDAIDAYDKIILADADNASLYLRRGAAYLAKGNIEKAVIDYQLGGRPIPLTVTVEETQLRDGKKVAGTVKQGQTLSVTRVQQLGNNHWLWATAVDGNPAARGWVMMSAVAKAPAGARQPGTVARSEGAYSRSPTGRSRNGSSSRPGYSGGRDGRSSGQMTPNWWSSPSMNSGNRMQGSQSPGWFWSPW